MKLNDYYSSEEIVRQEFRIEYNEINLIKIIKTVLEIYRISENITELHQPFELNMVSYS